MRPLVLLDVDGVLNALGPPAPSATRGSGPTRWERGTASALGRSWPIRWSTEAVAAVAGWLPRADVEWLTTWGHAANEDLRALLGLPELPVAGTPDGPVEAGPLDAGPVDAGLLDAEPDPAEALARVTPAAADPLTGRWWKFDVVRARLAREPGRRLVWLDDDLRAQPDVQAWVEARTSCLLVAPDPVQGLLPADLAAVDRFLLDDSTDDGLPR